MLRPSPDSSYISHASQLALCHCSYTREMYTDGRTTHLVAAVPKGAKYCSAITCEHVRVVRPEWLLDSVARGALLDEDGYACDGPDMPAIGEALDGLLESERLIDEIYVFSRCQFYLVGFDEGVEEDGKGTEGTVVKGKLSRVIRRERGTIYWNVNEYITHIIVADGCNDSLRRAAIYFALQLQGPVVVSPRWVVASCLSRQLERPRLYHPRPAAAKLTFADTHSVSLTADMPTSGSQAIKRKEGGGKVCVSNTRTLVFRGAIFVLIRPTPPEGGADWKVAEYEDTIKMNGGQVLNQGILKAIQRAAESSEGAHSRRTCYVVSTGGYPREENAVFNPILGELMKAELCYVEFVTPIWVLTCVAEQRESPPGKHPPLFEPSPHHILRLPSSANLVVAFTGFVGFERAGVRHLLQFIGAKYTENMTTANTHLICKAASGPKFKRALEWGIKVVTPDWLYHLARYGCGGRTSGDTEAGHELRFSVSDTAPHGRLEAKTAPDTHISTTMALVNNASHLEAEEEDPLAQKKGMEEKKSEDDGRYGGGGGENELRGRASNSYVEEMPSDPTLSTGAGDKSNLPEESQVIWYGEQTE